jgi:nucleotide-binding universal stress UspA family protein
MCRGNDRFCRLGGHGDRAATTTPGSLIVGASIAHFPSRKRSIAMHYVCTVENGRTIPIDIHRILVPVDFSEASEAALEYAIDLASRHGATIDVLHVWELAPYPGLAQYAGEEEEEGDEGTKLFAQHVHELATARLKDLLDAHRRDNVQLNGIIESGEPIKVIPRFANGYDLIVMGAHDEESPKRLFFGNVADRVAGEVRPTVVGVRREDERHSHRELRESLPSGI